MKTIGTPELRAWSPAPGVVWVQTRNPHYARRLAKPRHARLVAYAVTGPFLEIFEFPRSLRWAEKLIAQLTGESDPPPNGQFCAGTPHQSRIWGGLICREGEDSGRSDEAPLRAF